MPTHPHNSNDPHSGRPQIPTAPAEATWSHSRQPTEPIISSDPPAPARKTGPKAGKRVELARYTVRRGGERILYGQRVDGRVRITDRPAEPADEHHRAHLVENELESTAEVDALVADYLASAEQLQTVPAAATPYDIALAQLAGQ